jgi:phage terminase large subunit GpA-like protein
MGKGVTATVYYYSNLNIKDILARLRGNQDPAEGVTYEVPDNVPDEFLRQMESEHRVKKSNGTSVWEQIGKRPNHFLDTEAMGVAGLVMMKLIGRESLADNDPAEEIAENNT